MRALEEWSSKGVTPEQNPAYRPSAHFISSRPAAIEGRGSAGPFGQSLLFQRHGLSFALATLANDLHLRSADGHDLAVGIFGMS